MPHQNAALAPSNLRPPSLAFGDVSVELSPQQALKFTPDVKVLPLGTRIFLTHLSSAALPVQVEAAARLQAMGYSPVPHLAARNFVSVAEFVEHLAAHGRNGISQALFLGGNPLISTGPLTEAAMLLSHPAMAQSSIRTAFIGGYPEGHSAIAPDVLGDALKRKLARCAELGIKPHIVSQFAFDGEVMAAWARRLQSEHPGLAVRIGLAGVTSLPQLIKFAAMCGVGPSLAALKRSGTGLFNVLSDRDPADLIETIEAAYPKPAGPLDIHFFPFGGWQKTSDWLAGYRSR
ncbi:methylenetetrahydrofolate reductase [Aminobacter aganoensis]|uniref:Methylenetetrahydrofolate reductase (NADPH) n=1 Tax=Aminobacter aganoensis TaxID=83264 RepID=A0A7X0FB65_9HYPH|nr:methylenetetrahydrofolate reductase [Aminobacter aganoensis]MBB6356470.1 methylenetetrahydrofolate reductase (NADPH) [Aminobacter aganoensis]